MSESSITFRWEELTQYWLLAVGVGIVAVTVAVSEMLPPNMASELHAMILVFIAAVYAGFAFADGSQRTIVTEVVGIAVFCGLALIGLWIWLPALVVGYAGHAFWDLFHHPNNDFGATVVGWYIPFCIVIDLLIASYIFVLLLI